MRLERKAGGVLPSFLWHAYPTPHAGGGREEMMKKIETFYFKTFYFYLLQKLNEELDQVNIEPSSL